MIFLITIMMCYVFYGLSTTLFPSVWVRFAEDIGAEYTLIGVISVISTAMTGIMGAVTYKLRNKFGTSITTSIGVVFFAMSLLLYYFTKSLSLVCLALAFAGIGAGIMEITCNSYVIKAYDAGKQTLMHAFWGLGSTIAPMIMSFTMVHTSSYKNGFLYVAIALVVLLIIMIILKIYWNNKKKSLPEEYVSLHSVSKEEKQTNTNLWDIVKIPNGVLFLICYVTLGAINSIENTWIATLVMQKGSSFVATAGATAATFFFATTTATRVLHGLMAKRLNEVKVIYAEIFITIIIPVLLFFVNDNIYFMYVVAALMGIGVALIVPLLCHSIKYLFEEKYLGMIVSCSTLASFTGCAIMNAFTSIMIKNFGINSFQVIIIILAVIGLFTFKELQKRVIVVKK